MQRWSTFFTEEQFFLSDLLVNITKFMTAMDNNIVPRYDNVLFLNYIIIKQRFAHNAATHYFHV